MNKILRLISSKKYWVMGICFALILLFLNVQVLVKAAETKKMVKSATAVNEKTISPMSGSTNPVFTIATTDETDTVPIDLLHADCITDLEYATTPSTTFNPISTYDLSFVIGAGGTTGGLNGFYDINGDSLPDYIYTNNQTYSEGNNIISSNYYACLYLNNGQGWTKQYRCRAQTRKNNQTGQLVSGSYWGDCSVQ